MVTLRISAFKAIDCPKVLIRYPIVITLSVRLSVCQKTLTLAITFYASRSNDRGHIVFVLSVCLFVCLFVCLLSTLTFAITFELLEVEI